MAPVWTKHRLLRRTPYNENTTTFTFVLPDATEDTDDEVNRLNVPIGSFVLVRVANGERGGGDAVRPYAAVFERDGEFDILVKRYDEWGKLYGKEKSYLNHSYKPPGVVSNFIHNLNLNDSLEFKYTHRCVGPLTIDVLAGLKSLTLIAVGAGIAPHLKTLSHLTEMWAKGVKNVVSSVVLLYGARNVVDCLMKEQLMEWEEMFPDKLKVVFCVGSRYHKIVMGAKTAHAEGPPPPADIDTLRHSEIGWVEKEKILKYAFPPSEDTRVVVCGLPAVYDKLCGSRFEAGLSPWCALKQIGYTDSMVIKL